MSVTTVLASLGQALVGPIGKVMEKRIERKTARDAIKGKAALAAQEGTTNITLTDSEWETVAAGQLRDSWKDEYALIIVSSPYVAILFGAMASAFGHGDEILTGTVAALTAMAALGVDWGFLLAAVILGSFGLKVWRM